MSPYIQTAMAQAMQAIITGSPLPPNCMVVTIPIQQAQQMFPQLMMNYASGGGAMTFPQQPSYYDQLYQPQISPYQNQPLSNAVVPYSNYYSQGYNQPIVPYTDYNHKSKKKNRNGKNNRLEPHSNVYNSSSFDSDMDNLSWSRLFGTHNHIRHSKQQKQDQAALNYNQKYKRQDRAADSLTSSSSSSSSTTTSSSTTSDETIRRVNLSTKQPSSQSSSLKQQTKGSLPFKYSSEFVPGTGKQQQSQKSNKKETKVKYDDVFVVKKTQPPSSQQ